MYDIETYGCPEFQVTVEDVAIFFRKSEIREDEVLKYSMALIRGVGTSEDPESAACWIRSISGKDPYARYILGMMKVRGIGLRRNRKSGIKDVQAASKQGCVAAVIKIAEWMTKGTLLPRNLDQAEALLDELGDYPFAYYRKAFIAIERGSSPRALMTRALRSCMEIDYSDNPEIQYLAAGICESGLSNCGKDLEGALRFYRMADEVGHPTAGEEAERIRALLNNRTSAIRNTGIPWMDRIIDDITDSIAAIQDEGGLASRLGIRTKRAYLFVGAPGTGKTYAAKTIAKAVGAHVIYLSANELLSRYVGGEQKAINHAIDEANDHEVSVVIIDECDAVMQIRDENNASYVNTCTDSMLMMLDGVRTVPEGCVRLFFGITNTPWLLDPAFLRSGRFEIIRVGLPNAEERMAVMRTKLDGRVWDMDADLEGIVARTDGYSNADVAKIIEDAALIAYRRCRKSGDFDGGITQSDLEEALSASASTVAYANVLRLEEWCPKNSIAKDEESGGQVRLIGYY